MTIRIYKRDCDEEYAGQYFGLPIGMRPKGLEYDNTSRRLSYDYVHGSAPTSWLDVWTAARSYLWFRSGSFLDYDQRAFASYMVAHNVPGFNNVWDFIAEYQNYTPVKYCHGDLTLFNCVMRGEDVIFLDPGFARGLPCKEMDESKLWLCLYGLGEQMHPGVYPPPDTGVWPCGMKRIHIALMIAHLIRLIKHKTYVEGWALRMARTFRDCCSF